MYFNKDRKNSFFSVKYIKIKKWILENGTMIFLSRADLKNWRRTEKTKTIVWKAFMLCCLIIGMWVSE